MEYLLDTHTAIWLLSDTNKLSKKARMVLEDIDNVCHLSVASVWEISIKSSLGKLNLGLSVHELDEAMEDSEINILPISMMHIDRLSRLKSHHRDPFD